MLDIAMITAALGAAASAVGLFDKIADQIERFITKRPEPVVPVEHRMRIESTDEGIVASMHGSPVKTITAADLQDLPDNQLRHIMTLEKSMEGYYKVWESVYPQLATIDSLIQKAKVEQQLGNLIQSMKSDLDRILSFLESCGLYLDDHYQHIRELVREYEG